MKAQDIMNTEFPTVSLQASTAAVARLILDSRCRGVPVVDDGGKMLGLVTERDIVVKHANVHAPTYLGILGTVISLGRPGTDEEIQRALAVTAGDLMERHVRTVGPDASVEDVASLMVEDGVDPVPVVEQGRVVGLITRPDIMRLVLIEEEDGAPPG